MKLASKSNQLPILALVCVAVYCCRGDKTGGRPTLRILNGTRVGPGKYPFIASIEKLSEDEIWLHTCGGTVLDEQHILTAASCVVLRDLSGVDQEVRVRLGCHQLSKCELVGSTYNVSKFMIHHGFEKGPDGILFINDVAILKLASEIEFKLGKGPGAVRRVNLAETSETCCDDKRMRLQAVGWGIIDDLGTPTDFLHEAQLSSIRKAPCEDVWEGATNEDMICSGNSTSNACEMDFGGPLLLIPKDRDPIQVGIVSMANQFCGDKPSVAMKVASFRNWIEECSNGRKCETL